MITDAKIDFNRRNGRHRCATRSDSGFEAPRTYSVDGFLIKSEASALHDLNIGCMAVQLNDRLERHNSLEFSFPRFVRIRWVRAIEAAWSGFCSPRDVSDETSQTDRD